MIASCMMETGDGVGETTSPVANTVDCICSVGRVCVSIFQATNTTGDDEYDEYIAALIVDVCEMENNNADVK